MNFGQAIEMLKKGLKVARKGWNGNGIFIELQVPDAHSKMTQPYIFIDTLGLQTNNPNAPKGRVPWFASQTDMLAEDWQIVENEEVEKTDGFTLTVDDVYIVWWSKTLQNWKALVSTTVSDGMYYEVTYNGDKDEIYVDAYKKWKNKQIKNTISI